MLSNHIRGRGVWGLSLLWYVTFVAKFAPRSFFFLYCRNAAPWDRVRHGRWIEESRNKIGTSVKGKVQKESIPTHANADHA